MKAWREGEVWHIDVRGLPAPEPFVAIVGLIAGEARAAPAVIVHHERDPVFLYPELAERGWAAERIEGDPGEFRLRLFRAG